MNRNNPFEWSESEGQLFTTLITQMGGLYTDNPQGEYKANEIDSFINEASGVAYTNLTSPNGYSKSGNIVFGKGFVEDSPSPDPILKTPFYVENIGTETNTFGIVIYVHQDEPVQFTFEISGDGKTWEEHTINSDSEIPQFLREFTEKLYVRAKTNTYSVYDEEEDSGYNIEMACMNNFNVGGNIMSLLYGSDFTGDETVFPQDSSYTFNCLFGEIHTLVSAKDLILPATTLAYSCYNSMFYGCTSLTEAPELPATTLAEECYSWMFEGCTSLNSVTVHVEGEWNANNTACWLEDVANSGTLYNLGGATNIPTNDSSGCPYGWVIEEAPEPEPPHPETLDWFYVEDRSGSNNTLTISANGYESEVLKLSYSYDKIAWTQVIINRDSSNVEINFLAPNTKIYLRAKSQHWAGDRGRDPYSTYIDCENQYSVGGNIMSLLFNSNFSNKTEFTSSNNFAFTSLFSGSETLISAGNLELPATILSSYCYRNMFWGCTSLISAPQLPATTLAIGCYDNMFWGCSSLTTAPELPATTLADGCYNGMFNGCSSLISAPELPATILFKNCYRNMFSGCTSLTEAPELPALNLVGECYRSMFSGCTSLNEINIYANSMESYENCTTDWLKGVAEEGVLNNMGALNYTQNSDSGIPTGWLEQYPERDVFYIENKTNEDGTVTIKRSSDSSPIITIKSSTDNKTWSVAGDTSDLNDGLQISIPANGKLYLGCKVLTWCNGKSSSVNPNTITCDKSHAVGGNIMSLLYGHVEFVDKTSFPTDISLGYFTFAYLFENNINLIDSSELELPATTLKDYCYCGMFQGCTNLEKAPEVLPDSDLIYRHNCCYRMFYGCTSLEETPRLYTTTLGYYSYSYMFAGCSSLKKVICYANDISENHCLDDWLDGVAAEGTFYNLGTAEYTTGASGIPEGWTIETSE